MHIWKVSIHIVFHDKISTIFFINNERNCIYTTHICVSVWYDSYLDYCETNCVATVYRTTHILLSQIFVDFYFFFKNIIAGAVRKCHHFRTQQIIYFQVQYSFKNKIQPICIPTAKLNPWPFFFLPILEWRITFQYVLESGNSLVTFL